MGKTRETFTTPVGRLVQGDCFEAQTKDAEGNLRIVKNGPNAGQPSPTYFIGVAFPKMLPNPQTGVLEQNHEFNAFYAMLDRVARTEFPALFPNPNGPCVNPLFAFKVIDGDGLDRQGKSNATKEGFAGCWVVRFSSAYAPKVVQPVGGAWQAITDKNMLKRGYFVRVAGSVTGNDSAQQPGLYVNLDMVELAGYGAEIVSGPDAASAFGSAPAAAIPGMMAAPPAAMPAMPAAPAPGQPAMPPAVPGQPAAPLAQPGYPAAATPSPAAGSPAPANPAAPPVQPYTGYMGVPGAQPGAPAAPLPGGVPGASSPPLPGPAGVPSAPPATPSPTKVMTAAAGGATYESFIASGWTDEQMIAGGYMVMQ